jgi:predicted dinucleotide-binding enzyme
MYSKQTKIGVLGSGAVGQRLASAFATEGNPVVLGTRNPSKPGLEDWKRANPTVEVGSFETAAQFGEILVLAVIGSAANEILAAAGAENLAGKLVLDATNPIDTGKPPENGVLHFFTNLGESLMEQLQNAFPEAHFVKAFNSVGNAIMYKPAYSEKPTMFIAGNNVEAKKDATQILEAFGFEVSDMGAAAGARAIEPLCMLWCIPGFLQNQWTHAFRLLKN